jgi:hypothetical protein
MKIGSLTRWIAVVAVVASSFVATGLGASPAYADHEASSVEFQLRNFNFYFLTYDASGSGSQVCPGSISGIHNVRAYIGTNDHNHPAYGGYSWATCEFPGKGYLEGRVEAFAYYDNNRNAGVTYKITLRWTDFRRDYSHECSSSTNVPTRANGRVEVSSNWASFGRTGGETYGRDCIGNPYYGWDDAGVRFTWEERRRAHV